MGYRRAWGRGEGGFDVGGAARPCQPSANDVVTQIAMVTRHKVCGGAGPGPQPIGLR